MKRHNLEGLQLGWVIAISMTLFTYLGNKLDKHQDSSPLFLLLGAFLGIAISALELYRYIKNQK